MGHREGGEDTEERQERPPYDGERLGEPAELREQDGEDEHDGHEQDEEQVAERILLLLVEAAVFDRRAGRQDDPLAHLPPDFCDGAAEVATREARLDGHRLAEVFTADLRLPALVLQRAELIEGEKGPGRRLEEELPQTRDVVGMIGLRPDPDVDRNVPLEGEGGHVAEDRGVCQAPHLVDVEAGACDRDRVGPQGEGRARHDHPVEDVDHAVDVLHQPGDLSRLRREHGLVRREDLDLDRGGRPGEVADEVVEDPRELDMEDGLRGVDLLPELIGYLLDGALAVMLELHEEVARVRLGDGERQAGTRAPRVAFHLRGRLQDVLDL